MERLVNAVAEIAKIAEPHAELRPGAYACREVTDNFQGRINAVAADLRTAYPFSNSVVDKILNSGEETLPRRLERLQLCQAYLVIDDCVRHYK